MISFIGISQSANPLSQTTNILEANFMPPKFEPSLDSRTQQFMFPSPFPTSITNASIFSDHARSTQGELRNTSSIQPMSLKSGIPQNRSTMNSTNTLFPKPIDVVALLSGADQFSPT